MHYSYFFLFNGIQGVTGFAAFGSFAAHVHRPAVSPVKRTGNSVSLACLLCPQEAECAFSPAVKRGDVVHANRSLVDTLRPDAKSCFLRAAAQWPENLWASPDPRIRKVCSKRAAR